MKRLAIQPRAKGALTPQSTRRVKNSYTLAGAHNEKIAGELLIANYPFAA